MTCRARLELSRRLPVARSAMWQPRGAALLAGFLALGLVGCTGSSTGTDDSSPEHPVVSGTVFLWVGADKDGYVSCEAGGPPCPGENSNFGTNQFLRVAFSAVALKKAYVHFTLPQLPPGTEVQEAYLELFHPGTREDGKSDDVRIPVAPAAAPWSPMTLTLANEPNRQLIGGVSEIKLNSAEWSGTEDLAALVRGWLADRATNHGFYIYWPDANAGIEKGFYSNNDSRRTASDLGLSPRLLLQVRLPEGRTSADISLPTIPVDNDLPFDGQSISMLRIAGGADWPASWSVREGL